MIILEAIVQGVGAEKPLVLQVNQVVLRLPNGTPFMVAAYKIKPEMRDVIPAVTHEDGTGRLQTVERDANPLYWKLIRRV